MFNWNTDAEKLKKEHPKEYKIWYCVQLINYGLEGEKLDAKFIKKNWEKIKEQLLPDRRKALEYLIWHKKWVTQPGLLPDRSNYWRYGTFFFLPSSPRVSGYGFF